MTASAQPPDLHAEIADHRAHATELVAAYRDAHARLGDPVAAFACTVGSAYTVLCHRRTAQVLAAAVQVIAEMQDAAAEKKAERPLWNEAALDLIRQARASLIRAREVVPAHQESPWLLGVNRWIGHADAFTGGDGAYAAPHAFPGLTHKMFDVEHPAHAGQTCEQYESAHDGCTCPDEDEYAADCPFHKAPDAEKQQAGRAGVDRRWGPLAASGGELP